MTIAETTAVSTTVIIVCMAVILDCFEILHARRDFAANGMFSWLVRRSLFEKSGGVLPRRWLDRLLTYPQWLSLVTAEMFLAILAICLRPEHGALWCVALMVPLQVLSMVRNGRFGGEGSFQMILAILVALSLYLIAPDPLSRRAVMWYIAAQSILAYVTAGVVKLLSEDWRSGKALQYVFVSDLFGFAPVSGLFTQHDRLCQVMAWSVIAFECTSPLLVLGGPSTCTVFLCCGMAFHLAVSVSHGLNLFLPAFVATYPALLLTAADAAAYSAGFHL